MTDEPTMQDRLVFQQLELPSDQLTIGALRRKEPQRFDLSQSDLGEDTVYLRKHPVCYEAVALQEMTVASLAFHAAAGDPPERDLEPSKEARRLAFLYQEYGIAKDRTTANQLVRFVQEQGEAQALSQYASKGRPPVGR